MMHERALPIRPRRLVLRLYAFGVASLVVSVAALMLLYRWSGTEPLRDHKIAYASHLLRSLVAVHDRPTELQAALERLEALDHQVALYDLAHRVQAGTAAVPEPLSARTLARLARAQLLVPGERLTLAMPIAERGAMTGYAVLVSQGPPPPPLDHAVWAIAVVLVCFGVGSLLVARSLARPLQRLATVARALGDGDLHARVRLSRRDEFGELAAAFDHMADRMTELLRSQREFLANVSHELRTPLSRIRVAIDLAAEGNEAVARRALAGIAEDLVELDRLLDDLLTVARLDLAGTSHGVPPLRRGPVDMGRLIEDVVRRFTATHPQRAGCPVRAHVDAALPAIEGDASLLGRVLGNLLDNASKYSDPDQPITIQAGQPGGQRDGRPPDIEISITDHGIGIAPEDLAHVFTPFFRTDRSRARTTGGVGLGLALARRIVRAHGGELWLESSTGKGTTARFRVPAAGSTSARAVET